MGKDKEITGENLSPMFGGIIRHYDLINHVFTWGMDIGWRKKLVACCLEINPREVLDLGCGTGDLAISIALLAPENLHVTACDFSREMLAVASQKARKVGVDNKISFINADAANFPFSDSYFDCVGISFAFRNLIYKNASADRHLAEILRVLKPGGSCFIAETSQPRNKFIQAMHHFYIRTYVYTMGLLISGDRAAYKYLAESAVNFYGPDELGKILITAGFKQVFYQPLFFGAAGIYRLIK
ncbi:MAG: ubiquinone/menaquinone biosynthesis methyltransferase [Syntrophaceae bacterium]|nr:ubiquinone/menaquinone biosynthesis methyltransferase [Syntrophaceae bacterium]NMD05103.1 ubiquinone/menaquinone biosynthesis methyltransferase [Deltaproteobacteria bacterium]